MEINETENATIVLATHDWQSMSDLAVPRLEHCLEHERSLTRSLFWN
jgi:hypothetical protein